MQNRFYTFHADIAIILFPIIIKRHFFDISASSFSFKYPFRRSNKTCTFFSCSCCTTTPVAEQMCLPSALLLHDCSLPKVVLLASCWQKQLWVLCVMRRDHFQSSPPSEQRLSLICSCSRVAVVLLRMHRSATPQGTPKMLAKQQGEHLFPSPRSH